MYQVYFILVIRVSLGLTIDIIINELKNIFKDIPFEIIDIQEGQNV
jgi:hypothetical protein